MTTSVEEWVDDVSRTTHPERVVWCDGSDAENDRLVSQMVGDDGHGNQLGVAPGVRAGIEAAGADACGSERTGGRAPELSRRSAHP